MTDILTNGVFLSAVFTIVGLVLKHQFPWIIPFMGPAEKAVKELIELHDKSEEANTKIIERASNMKVVGLLKKHLK